MPRPVIALVVAGLAAVSACARAGRALGGGPAGAEGAGALLEALADRFGPIDREPGFDALRPKLARAAFVPSRVFDDAGVWTRRGDGWRAVEFVGVRSGAVYRIGVRGGAPEPSAVGEYRGRLRLGREARGRFEWSVEEVLRAGPLRPGELSGALTALFRGAEPGGEAAARAAIHEALPRATELFSRLFRIDTLALRPGPGGATAVRLVVRLTPEGIRPFAPRYAAFLVKYAAPIRLAAVARDGAGAVWWTVRAGRDLWTAELGLRDGRLAPLAGPDPGGIPGRLRVTIDYATRMGRFGVGARGLVAEVDLSRTASEKGFVARFSQEPDWELPFLVEPLMRGALRYPFEGPGSEAGWAAREAPGGGLLLVRHYRARVRESWLVRWLGGMTSGAVGEFRRGAEREADLFHRECLLALRDDLLALAAPR